MTEAYIIFPDIFLDALDNQVSGDNQLYSRLFLDKLMKEKERTCTLESKKFRGFVSSYHLDSIIEIVIDLINSQQNALTDVEINLIQLVLFAVDRDGIEAYPYKDNYTPLLDLARDKADSYDVFIVCNNSTIKQRIKEKMASHTHFGNYVILSSKEALFKA